MAMVPAAMANWMNGSDMDDRASRAEIQRVGSNPLTSPANRVGKSPASKRVMGPTPETPSSSARQVSSVPIPTGVTSPMPVTATLRGMATLYFARDLT